MTRCGSRQVTNATRILAAALLLAACSPAAAPPAASPSPEPQADVRIVSKEIAFDTLEASVAADTPFTILHLNDDRGVPHDVDIRTADGTVVADTREITGVSSVIYRYEGLAAGTYRFICSLHPIPAMTGTLTVR
jgi:plastocyanin